MEDLTVLGRVLRRENDGTVVHADTVVNEIAIDSAMEIRRTMFEYENETLY